MIDKELLVFALAKETGREYAAGSIEIPCSRCQDTCMLSPAGATSISVFREARVICVRCACRAGLPGAAEFYRGAYGKEYDQPRVPGLPDVPGTRSSAFLAVSGPLCAHLGRRWYPVIELKRDGIAHVAAYKYCDECAAKLTIDSFPAPQIMEPRRLVLIQEGDLARRYGLGNPPEPQLFTRRLNG